MKNEFRGQSPTRPGGEGANQQTTAATKEDDTYSTATMVTTTFNTAEKEDDTDSTASKTTTTFTSTTVTAE